ncbi:MAG: bifunctional phosphoglucose/phosphomannose isomerase [Actinomycetota bacterium]|nr:bifunctional phosphoglucose/phosphomannose isomerase [Actinomycetota bacterium]
MSGSDDSHGTDSMVGDRVVVQPVTVPETKLDLLDSERMLEAALSMPQQVAAARDVARGLDGLPDREEIEQVVMLGMGGSAIAGDVVMAAAGPYLPLPVLVFRSYHVPAFVDEGTLVFAISFSGDTEETVEAVTAAALQGARVVAVTRGGELAHLAESWGVPVVPVPVDIPQPRAALGALAVPPLVVLEDIGLFPGASFWVDAAIEQLTIRGDQLARPENVAEQLARRIGRTMPVIHGGGGLGAVAAQRWKTDVNENAKCPAFWNLQSELCHNEVSGWGQHGDLTRQMFTLVNLRHDFEHPQVMHRFKLTADLLEEVVSSVEEVRAEGEGELAQLLDLILVGDLTSLHMAFQEGIDPGPIPAQEHIKNALATAAGEDQGASE